MSGHRKKAMLALAAASLAATLAPNAVAAAEPSWNGQYLVTLSANAKTGTSMAANRPEYPHKANYTFSSRCASDVCIATVVDAPPPKNEFIPRPIEYYLEWDSMGTGDQLAMGLPATRRHNRICPSQIDHGLHARSVRNPHRRLSYRYRQRHV